MWSSEQVQDWFREEGLDEYTTACAKHVKKGEEVLKFTYTDYERSLGMSDPLHKRKLSLALKVSLT